MTIQQSCIGAHGLLDLYGINPAIATNEAEIRQHLLHAAHLANATVLQMQFHHFGQDQGITGVLLLSESHMSIHTWPERRFAAIDIFMCGSHHIQAAVDYLIQAFSPDRHVFNFYARGQINSSQPAHTT